MILIACAGISRALSNERKRRFEALGDLMAAMRVLRLRMLNSMEPLGVLMRKSDAPLFRLLGENMREGDSLEECWNQLRTKARKSAMIAYLNDEDIRILNRFFESLGKSGREEQSALFAAILGEMEEAHARAKNRFADAAKLYTALGTLVGLGICILIV